MRDYAHSLIDDQSMDLVFIQLAKFYTNLLLETFKFDSEVMIEMAHSSKKHIKKDKLDSQEQSQNGSGKRRGTKQNFIQGLITSLITNGTKLMDKSQENALQRKQTNTQINVLSQALKLKFETTKMTMELVNNFKKLEQETINIDEVFNHFLKDQCQEKVSNVASAIKDNENYGFVFEDRFQIDNEWRERDQ